VDTANRQIARAAGLVMAAFALNNLIGLARQIIVLNTFGTSGEMDAFIAANRVSETLFTLVAGGALASAFIPTFTSLLVKDDERGAWKLASAIANLILLILTLAAVLAAILAPLIVRYLLAPGFADDPAQEQLLSPSLGIYGLAWGVLIGAAGYLLIQLPALLRLGGKYLPILGFKLPAVREVGRLMVPRVLGLAFVQLNFWVNIRLASRISQGSVTGVYFAFTLMLMPQVLIAQSIAIAALPTFSAQFAQNKLDEMRSSLATTVRSVLLLSIPATLGLIILRQPLIELLYQGGEFSCGMRLGWWDTRW
jgi:putative peptidoglycan lipid II flippase